MFAQELILELSSGDFCTQTRSFSLMREVNAIYSVFVIIQCDVSPDRSPKTGTINRQHIFGLTIHVANEYMKTSVSDFTFIRSLESSIVLYQRTICLHQIVFFHIFIIFCIHIFYVINVQSCQNLFLCVLFYILVLFFFQRRRHECQQECYDNNHYRSIDDSITITISIHNVRYFSC